MVKCPCCGYEFEQSQSITAGPLKACPRCKRRALQRLIGRGGGIIFRGSGFYQTDYRSDSYKRGAEAEKKGTAGSNGEKPAKSGDSKPVSKKAPGDAGPSESKKVAGASKR